MGRVWLAADEMLRRQVAIKNCSTPDGLTEDERELLRSWTLREAQAAGRVCHPNVVGIYDVLPGEDEPWIVMEYVPSRSLMQLIKESGPLPVDRVAGIGLALLGALDAAGRVGVLHLDVKPSNVLIADDGRVVLTDFSPAVTDAGISALARSGLILGSPNYIAPERLFDGVSTPSADLWSLGATLYHAVEGRPPYARETPAATLRALASGIPDHPRRAGPLVPVLNGLLQRDPEARIMPAEAEDRLRRLTDAPRVTAKASVPVRIPAPVASPARGHVSSTGASSDHRPNPMAGTPARPAGPFRRRIRRPALAVAGVFAFILAFAMLTTAIGRLPWADRGARAEMVRAAPTAPVAPPPEPFVLPRDFRWWNDQSGFSVAVPSRWPESQVGRNAVVFTAPSGHPSLRISSWKPDQANIVAALIDEERAVTLPAYKRIRIEALPQAPDAIWEYTFRDPRAGPVRGLQRVVDFGGRTYLIEWRTSRAAWAVSLQNLAVVLDSFRPLRGT
jgi:hypothetical protein